MELNWGFYMEVKRKEKLQGKIEFRVPRALEADYKYVRSRDYEVQEALRSHAEKLIGELKATIKENERTG